MSSGSLSPRALITGDEHVRAELGEVLAGTAAGRRDDARADAVPLARPGGRGPRRGRVRGRDGNAAGHRHRGRVVIELAEIEAARERIAGAAVRTPLRAAARREPRPRSTSSSRTSSRSTRSRSAARPTRSCWPPERARARGWSPPAPGTWRRASRGGAGARRARHDRGSRARAAGQARGDRTARRAGAQAALRRLVERDRHQPRRRRRGAVRAPGRRTRA